MLGQFDKVYIALRYWLHGKGYHKALNAMSFAALYHTGMRKDNITPEFHHQISIASYIRTLPNLQFQEDTIAAAFLHDVAEDYHVPFANIEYDFGKNITDAVKRLTKSSEQDLSHYYNEIATCPIASIVKGGDRIHNFQTMTDVFTTEKQKEYILECNKFILPALKEARRKFPSQEPAYENIKLVLMSQIELINHTIENTQNA